MGPKTTKVYETLRTGLAAGEYAPGDKLPSERTLVAKRPYDLRHAAVSTWLSSGVEPQEVAARAGHSVAVLYRVYANCLDGGAATANARIEQALQNGH